MYSYEIIFLVTFWTICYSNNFMVTVNIINPQSPNRVFNSECNPVSETNQKATRCCYASQNDGVIDTCSPYDANGDCFSKSENYQTAESECAAAGRQLCTSSEYESLCRGTGCNVDKLEVWTRTSCSPLYIIATNGPNPNSLVANGETEIAYVRCCTNEAEPKCCTTPVDGANYGDCYPYSDDDTFWAESHLACTAQEEVSYTEAKNWCEGEGDEGVKQILCPYDVLSGGGDDCVDSGCAGYSNYVWTSTLSGVSYEDIQPKPVKLHFYYIEDVYGPNGWAVGHNHLFTTDPAEVGTTTPIQIGQGQYVYQGVAGKCFKTQVPGTIPLYRYYHDRKINSFYTYSANEMGRNGNPANTNNGYVYQGVACYCYSSDGTGRKPLWRFYKHEYINHFYTTDGSWSSPGYRRERIQCYVL